MVDTIIEKLLAAILTGGHEAFIAILLLIIVVLIFDRRRLIADVQKKDEKIDKIVEDYYKGNLTLAEALSSLKHVLYEIKSKI